MDAPTKLLVRSHFVGKFLNAGCVSMTFIKWVAVGVKSYIYSEIRCIYSVIFSCNLKLRRLVAHIHKTIFSKQIKCMISPKTKSFTTVLLTTPESTPKLALIVLQSSLNFFLFQLFQHVSSPLYSRWNLHAWDNVFNGICAPADFADPRHLFRKRWLLFASRWIPPTRECGINQPTAKTTSSLQSQHFLHNCSILYFDFIFILLNLVCKFRWKNCIDI